MFFLATIALIIALVIVVNKRDEIETKLKKTQQALAELIPTRDREWRQYIESFRERTKSDEEKRLLDEILAGSPVQVEQQPIEPAPQPQAASETNEAPLEQPPQPQPSQPVTPAASAPPPPKRKTKADNALVLLYLGAFLFVVAAGLFVGFADFSGEVRTMVVAVVALIFYLGGLYMHQHMPRLKQAGVSFAAIGMAIAPLVGLSAYSYVLDQTQGSLIWLLTSVGVFLLYLHALMRLRSNFIGYLLIFSFVSLLQSSVSIFDAPVYYFIWMLIITGMLLQIISRYVTSLNLTEIKQPANLSSQVIVPLSIFISFITVANEGYTQLATTFVFASIFYGLNGIDQTGKGRVSSFQLAHILAILAIATGAYAFDEQLLHVAYGLLGASAVHLVALLSRFPAGEGAQSYLSSTALLVSIPMVLTAWSSAPVLLIGLILTTVLGLIITFWSQQVSGLYYALIALGLMPYVVAWRLISPSLDATETALLALAVPILVAGLRIIMLRLRYNSWLQLSAPIALLVSLVPVYPALTSGEISISLLVGVLLAGLFALYARLEKIDGWSLTSSLLIFTPVVHAFLSQQNPELTLTLLLAIAWCVGLVLLFRDGAIRWIGSLAWFILPLAIGIEGFDFEITPAVYAWLYIMVMVGFMLARTVLTVRREMDIEDKYKFSVAGTSYVAGYWFAAGAAFLAALMAENTHFHLSLISGLLIVAFWMISRYIEEDRSIVAIIPILLQVLVFSVFTPELDNSGEMTIALIASQLAALLGYMIYRFGLIEWLHENQHWLIPIKLTLFVAPVSVLIVYETYLIMPLTLAAAGGVLLLDNWRRGQSSRELHSYILVGALMWLMHHLGVDNLQAYTHVLAAVFAGYALWRWYLGDRAQSDSYLKAMFVVATIPLLLQALVGESGDLYGWWLIFQQIGFVLMGMLLNRRFLTKWGLYVSIGAVLYQMRDLQWAVLSILAVSIIGVAIYYLNRHNTEE